MSARHLVSAWLLSSLVAMTHSAVTAADDQDMLSTLAEGARLATNAITSGKGTVQYHYLRRLEGGLASETTTTYKVAFTGDRWRISANGTNVIPEQTDARQTTSSFHYEFACDGQRLVFYRPADKAADIADSTSNTNSLATSVYQGVLSDVALIGKGVGLSFAKTPGWNDTGWGIAWKEAVNGTERIHLAKTGSPENPEGPLVGLSQRFTLTLEPSQGFLWTEFVAFIKAPSLASEVLAVKEIVVPRLYANGVWGPGKSIRNDYDKNATNIATTTVDYAPDFQINAPIDGESLSLRLPSGTLVNDQIVDAEYTVP